MVGLRWGTAVAAIVTIIATGLLSPERRPTALAAPTVASTNRPNVVVVMTDDQRLDDLAQMPLTRKLLGKGGAKFDDYVVSFPLCCPSRATYLTGRYAHNHGVRSNEPTDSGGYQAFVEQGNQQHTIAIWLQEAGYRTGSIGRYLNFYGLTDPTEVPPGWDTWIAPPSESAHLMFDYTLNENGALVDYGDAASDYETDVLARRSAAFIRDAGAADQAFFLSVTTLAPHDENDELVRSPYDGPRPAPRDRHALRRLRFRPGPAYNEGQVGDKPKFVRRLRRLGPDERKIFAGSMRRRRRSLLAVDDLVGQLARTLRKHGELDHTYFFFTSDNGFLLGEHRLHGKIAGYEESVRVPLLVRGPQIKRGIHVNGVAGNVDLAPTILDIAGARADRRLDGISLLDALKRRRKLPARSFLLENLDPSKSSIPRYRGIRTAKFSYLEHANGAVELYDLRADPSQLHNLADHKPKRPLQRRLHHRLGRLQSCDGRSCRR